MKKGVDMMSQRDIKAILFELGVPQHTKGYNYLLEALKMYQKDQSVQFTKDVYPTIAKKFKAPSSGSVEKCIRYIRIETLANCKPEVYNKVFNIKDPEHITNGKFIAAVVGYIQLKEAENNE